jgi:hypothetical protein
MRIAHPRSLLPALLLLLALPIASHAQVSLGVSVNIEPPELPVYEQPPLPAVGWMWTPGYWAWGDDDYYWVPGTWVEPPSVGVLWTPGYWGFESGAYLFHEGYWGPHIGFYCGVNYGFGYVGTGFEGGEWRDGGFFYNRAVVNVGTEVHVTNVYNKTVINNTTITRVSYNGGPRGVAARPTPAEMAVANERHIPRTAAQETHIHAAATNKDLRASVNHGAPAVAATPKPGVFSGKGVVTAHNAPAHAAPEHAAPPHAAPAEHAAPAAHTETHAPAHAPTASHEPVAHPAAERPEAKPMAEHAAPPPHAAPAEHAAPPPHTAPAAHAAPPPHAAPAEHAAPPPHAAPAAAPPPQHAAPPPKAPPPEKKPEEEKH